MIEHKVEKSAHVSHLAYDEGRRTLQVTFKNGSRKSFAGVPSHVFDQMRAAPSIGKYFHNVIKLHYRNIDDAN